MSFDSFQQCKTVLFHHTYKSINDKLFVVNSSSKFDQSVIGTGSESNSKPNWPFLLDPQQNSPVIWFSLVFLNINT